LTGGNAIGTSSVRPTSPTFPAGLDAASLPPVPATRLFDVNPFDSLSSTLVRSRVQQGLFVDGLVPTGVAEYIRTHGLYRASVA